MEFQAQGILPKCGCFFQPLGRDSNVVNLHKMPVTTLDLRSLPRFWPLVFGIWSLFVFLT
jgi:hypothetical protein